jgi:hypothetical protein
VGQHIEQVALLGIDDLLHLGHLLTAEPLLGESLQEFGACVGRAPQFPKFGLTVEKLRQLSEEHRMRFKLYAIANSRFTSARTRRAPYEARVRITVRICAVTTRSSARA